MNKTDKKTLELALIVALMQFGIKKWKKQKQEKKLKPKYDKDQVLGSLKNIVKFSTRELEKLPPLTDDDLKPMAVALDEFGDQTKWDGQNRHLATVASFCLEMLENSQFEYDQKILNNLNKIVDHFDRVKKVPGPSFWAGSVAAEKWKRILEAT